MMRCSAFWSRSTMSRYRRLGLTRNSIDAFGQMQSLRLTSCEALTGALTRSVYLQQDRVRDFIEADSDRERFAAFSELVGVGRVTELQAELESISSSLVASC